MQFFRTIILSFFMISSLLLVGCGKDNDRPKDHVIVLDTSMSMVGKGGKNILPQVKDSLDTLIDKMKTGDSFSFVTFDHKVRFFPTIYIKDDNDKEILKKYVSVVEAKGKYTYTMKMMQSVMDHAESLQEKDDDRQQVIVVMTDALDDPPPASKREKLNIKTIAKNYQGKDWFIFFVSLGDISKDKNIKNVKDTLEKNVTPYTKVVDVEKEQKESKKDVQEVITEELGESVKEMQKIRSENEPMSVWPFIIAILVCALVLLVLFYLKKMNKIKLYGLLEYHDHTAIRAEAFVIDLGKLLKSKVRIGKAPGCEVRLEDQEENVTLVVEALSINGNIKNSISSESGEVSFKGDKKENFLIDGDVFQLGSYTFKYIEEQNEK